MIPPWRENPNLPQRAYYNDIDQGLVLVDASAPVSAHRNEYHIHSALGHAAVCLDVDRSELYLTEAEARAPRAYRGGGCPRKR